MKNHTLLLTTVAMIVGTTTIAIAQSAGICYIQANRKPTQYGSDCNIYTECPGGTICSIGSDKKTPMPIVMAVKPCALLMAGGGVFPDCKMGTPVLGGTGTPATVTVPTQECTGSCLSGPPE